jgi:hypothetical protein
MLFIKVFPFQVTLHLFLITLFWVCCLIFQIHPDGILIALSGLLASVGISWFVFKDKLILLKTSLAFILVVLVSGMILMQMHDFSYDGQLYHQEAIHLIKSGWNFIYNSNLSTENRSYAVVYYPKAIWILNAAFYDISSNLEFSKCVLIVFIACSFLLFLDFADTYLLKYKYVFASILVLNPIVLGEFFTFYVDGVVSLLFLLTVLNFLIYLKRFEIQYIISGMLSSILLANCKFSSLAFSILILFFMALFMVLFKREILKKTYWLLIPFAIVFCLVSINPYVTNTIYKGSPLYPIISKDGFDKIQTMESQASADFNKKDRFSRFLYSLFGKTSSLIEGMPQLKVPFTFSLDELSSFTNPCPRSGGFGPLFSGVLLTTLGVFFYYFRFTFDKMKILYFLSAMLILVFVNSESWWARLSPHFYFIIVSLLIILVLYGLPGKKTLYFSFSLLVLNSFLIFMAASFIELASEIKLAREVAILKSAKIERLKVDFCPFVEFNRVKMKEYTASNKIRIEEYGFSYDEVPCQDCKNSTYSLYSNAKLCMDGLDPSLCEKLEQVRKEKIKDWLLSLMK